MHALVVIANSKDQSRCLRWKRHPQSDLIEDETIVIVVAAGQLTPHLESESDVGLLGMSAAATADLKDRATPVTGVTARSVHNPSSETCPTSDGKNDKAAQLGPMPAQPMLQALYRGHPHHAAVLFGRDEKAEFAPVFLVDRRQDQCGGLVDGEPAQTVLVKALNVALTNGANDHLADDSCAAPSVAKDFRPSASPHLPRPPHSCQTQASAAHVKSRRRARLSSVR
ncbi:hypothetical protein EV649_6979 [Kribbella sp. VKM Ac-2569]|nr:hypothetical protein EV649_6979 [Kribbella sp. VKM Ac-2569]